MDDRDDARNTVLGELHALVDHPLAPWERQRVMDELLIAEAADLACGLRHVTIVHGWLGPATELEQLDPILDRAAVFLGGRCARMVAGPFHCTITIAGDGIDATVDAVVDGLVSLVPASWSVIRSGRPA
jgi:hypothetical protein